MWSLDLGREHFWFGLLSLLLFRFVFISEWEYRTHLCCFLREEAVAWTGWRDSSLEYLEVCLGTKLFNSQASQGFLGPGVPLAIRLWDWNCWWIPCYPPERWLIWVGPPHVPSLVLQGSDVYAPVFANWALEMAVRIPADVIDKVRAQALQLPMLQTSTTQSRIFWTVGY